MKDLETYNYRPDRDDTDGRTEREPAYKAFTKDKRARITTSKTSEKIEYRNSERSGSRVGQSAEKFEGPAGGNASDRTGYGSRSHYRKDESGSGYAGREKKPYGHGEGDRSYQRREGRGGSEGGYQRREYVPRERRGDAAEGGDKRRSYNPNFDSSNRPVGHHRYGAEQDRAGGTSPERSRESHPYGRYGDRQSGYGQGRNGERYSSGYRDRSGYGERDAYRPNGSSDDRRPSQDRVDGGRYSGDRNSREQGAARRPYGGSREGRYGSSEKSFSQGKPRSGGGKYGKPSQGRPGGKNGRTARYDSENYPTFPAPVIEDKIRLNRYIAMSGICSRREADQFIQSGVVTVNGLTVTELGAKVAQTDEVRFNGNVIKNEQKVYIVMNKPKGYVTSVEDPHADKTVMDLLKNGCRERVYPVGRLDKNSLGVLLITNDGDMAKKLMHPTFEKKKVYQVSLDKPLTKADMDALVEGFELDDGEIHADAVSHVGDKKTEVGVEIHSGRNRIVRRMFEHLGYKVVKLDRVYFAGLTKQRLKRGEWRFLTPREVQALRSGQYE